MKKYKHLTSTEKEEIIIKHFEKKISQVKLALEYSVSRPLISQVCKKFGKSPLLKNYVLDDKEIVRLYTEDKKSINQIAKIVGVDRNAIKRRLNLSRINKKVSQRGKWSLEVPHYYLRLKIWTAKIIDRDGMKCKKCGVENSSLNRLEAHHIVPMRDITYPSMIFEMNNGICLCRKCHMGIHYHEKEYEIFFKALI